MTIEERGSKQASWLICATSDDLTGTTTSRFQTLLWVDPAADLLARNLEIGKKNAKTEKFVFEKYYIFAVFRTISPQVIVSVNTETCNGPLKPLSKMIITKII